MIDFGKLYCDLHPNELISNFCFKCKLIPNIKKPVWLASVQLAYVLTPNITLITIQPQSIKTLGIPSALCMK